jgi:hypothetical protein
MLNAKTWVGILIATVLMVCLAGAWYWSQPRVEVSVSGKLSPAETEEIAQAVERAFMSRSAPARLDFSFRQFLARIHGETTDRIVIKIEARPDETPKAGAALCAGPFCREPRQYEFARGINGWELTREMVLGRQ